MFKGTIKIKGKTNLSCLIRNEGFTIVEVMIAITILVIIVFAFTPLLLGSIQRITYAGDKSEALYQSQASVEADISYKETIDGYEVEFIFDKDGDQTTIEVPGGFIDSPQNKGEATAWLSTFLPYVPSIILSTPFLTEGYDANEFTGNLVTHIMGIDTSVSVQ